jgi:hypothetical protein
MYLALRLLVKILDNVIYFRIKCYIRREYTETLEKQLTTYNVHFIVD